MVCWLCHRRWKGDICDECHLVRFGTDLIYRAYESGSDDPRIRDFVRELEVTLKRDNRARKYFEAANEILLLGARRYINSPIPVSEVREFRDKPSARVGEVMRVLDLAKIAHLIGQQLVLGELGQRFVQVLPTGIALDDEGVRSPAEEMRGAICVALSKTLMDLVENNGGGVGRPRNYVLLMKRLSRQVLRELDVQGPMPKDIRDDEFFESGDVRNVVQTSPRQRERMLADLVGLDGTPRIFEAIRQEPGGHFSIRLKDSVVNYLERIRERWREERLRR